MTSFKVQLGLPCYDANGDTKLIYMTVDFLTEDNWDDHDAERYSSILLNACDFLSEKRPGWELTDVIQPYAFERELLFPLTRVDLVADVLKKGKRDS